jgi:hypothetical protein
VVSKAREYHAVLGENRRRLNRLIDRRGVAPLKNLFARAHSEQTAKLRAVVRYGRGDTFTAHQARVVMAQIRQSEAVIAARLAGELGDISEEAQREALHGLVASLDRLDPQFKGSAAALQLEEASHFEGIIDKRRRSLLRMHRESMSRYGARLVGDMEGELAQSVIQNETPLQAIDRIQETAQNQWWQAERIVRSETAAAYNASHHDGIAEVAEEIEDLMMQWNEHCGDDGEPLDDRVAVDSLALHGQIAPVGGVFTCPSRAPVADSKGNTKVAEGMAGEEFEYPPNRPNDRSVLAPWRKSWGIPGWQWKNGRKVWLVAPS